MFGSQFTRLALPIIVVLSLGASLYILFAARELHLAPGAIGLAAGVGNAFGLLASVGAGWIAGRLGAGRAIIAAAFIGGFAAFPLLIATPESAFLLLALASALANLTGQVYNITQVSLRQAIVPYRVQEG